MKLRGIDYGNVFNASGARGFHGEGYWFHNFWKPFGLNFDGITFVSKTVTINPHRGNMTNKFIPSCIKTDFTKGIVLNAVGLSNPGMCEVVVNCVCKPELQSKQFFVSFAPVSNDKIAEVMQFVRFINTCELSYNIQIGVQLNVSCPNAGTNHYEMLNDTNKYIDAFHEVNAPLLVKLNALTPVGIAREIALNERCDGLICSNTIPWGQLPDRINWKELFGTDVSPLQKFGGGGLSGKPLLPIVIDWIKDAREAGITKPIIGGGGILSKEDALEVLNAGANAIELGSVFILRPWRVQSIVRCAKNA
jgi:dihydroorotate dehydrogenase (NAD+) catalytic subunit